MCGHVSDLFPWWHISFPPRLVLQAAAWLPNPRFSSRYGVLWGWSGPMKPFVTKKGGKRILGGDLNRATGVCIRACVGVWEREGCRKGHIWARSGWKEANRQEQSKRRVPTASSSLSAFTKGVNAFSFHKGDRICTCILMILTLSSSLIEGYWLLQHHWSRFLYSQQGYFTTADLPKNVNEYI